MNNLINLKLLIRWSLRDLRERKLQVIAISLIIGLGTGAYAGLSSTTPWRQNAFDKSNESLYMFDLKLELAQGSWVNQQILKSIIEKLPHTEWIKAIEYRTVFPTSVNATTTNRSILVNGRIIGINVSSGSKNLAVNGIHIVDGRHIKPSETDALICIVESNFADYYNLKPSNQNISLPGGIQLTYVGSGLSPEYFMVIEGNAFMGESAFCALFAPLRTVQLMLQNYLLLPDPNVVNEAIFLLAPNADINVLETEIEDAFETNFPAISVRFTEKSEQPAYRVLEEDISTDQKMYFVISFIILLAAAFGTYNLVSRVVNSHRRQIGINMALGVPPRQLALRYLIFSFEIAVGGVIFGLLLATIIGQRLGTVVYEIIPLPEWEEWLVIDIFMQGAILGIIIPFTAAIIPIWRAIRVNPIEAIQTGYTLSTGKGVAPLLERIRFPGSIFFQLPFRNIARNPRRTLSTVFGVSLALCVFIALTALLNGSNYLLDKEQAIMEGDNPDRMNVMLNNFYNISQFPVTNMTQNTKIKESITSIQILGNAYNTDDSFTLGIHFFELKNNVWSPELIEGAKASESDNPGIILSKKTSLDLDVSIGDLLTIEHIFRKSSYEYSTLNSTFEVIGIYGSQVRFWAFVDISDSDVLNCTGLTNSIMLVPKPGVTAESIQEDFFQIQGYNGAQTITALVESYEELIEFFRGILTILQYAVMIMALLITFNTGAINIDERTREFATMGAFGTPIRTSAWMLMVESVIIGVLGTLIGYYPLGFITMEIFQIQVRTSMPEINLPGYLFPESIALIIFIGVILVALTPLLSIRKLTKMDLPSALRVIE